MNGIQQPISAKFFSEKKEEMSLSGWSIIIQYSIMLVNFFRADFLRSPDAEKGSNVSAPVG